MALTLSESPRHRAPEVKPFQAATMDEIVALNDVADEIEPPRDPPEPDLDPPPEPRDPPYWRGMDDAPRDRPVYTTADPGRDRDGTLTIWRTTREKINGHKGWQPIAYWAAVLTRQRLGFEPAAWRESMTERAEGAA